MIPKDKRPQIKGRSFICGLWGWFSTRRAMGLEGATPNLFIHTHTETQTHALCETPRCIENRGEGHRLICGQGGWIHPTHPRPKGCFRGFSWLILWGRRERISEQDKTVSFNKRDKRRVTHHHTTKLKKSSAITKEKICTVSSYQLALISQRLLSLKYATFLKIHLRANKNRNPYSLPKINSMSLSQQIPCCLISKLFSINPPNLSFKNIGTRDFYNALGTIFYNYSIWNDMDCKADIYFSSN